MYVLSDCAHEHLILNFNISEHFLLHKICYRKHFNRILNVMYFLTIQTRKPEKIHVY